jgi:hypothetical protein
MVVLASKLKNYKLRKVKGQMNPNERERNGKNSWNLMYGLKLQLENWWL